MTFYRWDSAKNILLKAKRNLCFEQVVLAIESGNLLEVVDHPNQEKYPNQKLAIINLDGYAHLIPFVKVGEEIFLKTIIPSRKATAKYLSGGENENRAS